jgi:hypothetical protein
MPKRKPDQVITHRLELGEYERKKITPLLDAKAMQGNIKAGAMLVGSVGLGFAAYTFYKWGKALTGWTTSTTEDIRDWKNNLLLLGDEDTPNNNVDAYSSDSYGYPFQLLAGDGGQAPAGNDVNFLGLPGWGIWPGVL